MLILSGASSLPSDIVVFGGGQPLTNKNMLSTEQLGPQLASQNEGLTMNHSSGFPIGSPFLFIPNPSTARRFSEALAKIFSAAPQFGRACIRIRGDTRGGCSFGFLLGQPERGPAKIKQPNLRGSCKGKGFSCWPRSGYVFGGGGILMRVSGFRIGRGVDRGTSHT